MGGPQQPFLYEKPRRLDDDRFPAAPFDPKAVTRASMEPRRPKPKPDGPLISFNRHPDAHEVLGQRSLYWKPMGSRSKWWIKAMRVVQLLLRVVELNGAAGVLVLMILFKKVAPVTAWVLRITPGVIILHCVYGIYHLFRAAGGRTPGSSAAYHTFAAVSDLCVVPIFAYGALAVRHDAAAWATILPDASVLPVFRAAAYYLLIADGGLHVLSLALSLYLGVMFRRIHMMPPDMNPLESHLTSRAAVAAQNQHYHKRNKSSLVTTTTATTSDSRLSTPLEDHRRSGAPYEDVSSARHPRVPFMHTRQGSDLSSAAATSKRDSRVDLPSRQYQVVPGHSPRSSVASFAEVKRASAPLPPLPRSGRSSYRGSYTEIPLYDDEEAERRSHHHRGGISTTGSSNNNSNNNTTTAPSPFASTAPSSSSSSGAPGGGSGGGSSSRPARFTEAWYTSDSLINRTQQRARAMETASSPNTKNSAGYRHSAYEPLSRPYAFDDDDDDDEESANEVENSHHRCSGYYHYTAAAAAAAVPGQKGYEDSHDESDLGTASLHPNPLRSHPLSDVPLNDRRVSGGGGGGSQDTKNSSSSSSSSNGKNKNTHNPGRRLSRRPRQAEEARQRTSSIQPDVDFVAKPYGSLRAGTPPVTTVGSDRQVSSGNDYGAQHAQQHQQPQPQRVRIPSIFTSSFGRRAVSGKIAEEGRGGGGMR